MMLIYTKTNNNYKGVFIVKKLAGQAFKFIYFFSCFFTLFTNYAHAYIDPSAVTYVIQAVAAVFIALGAVITVFRHKIAAFFRKNTKKGEKREIHVKEDETQE